MPQILLVVEGDGEVQAAPLLARRTLGELHGIYDWHFLTHRRGSLPHLKANGWAHFRRFLLAAYKEQVPILWLLDNDEGHCCGPMVAEIYSVILEIGLRQPFAMCFWTREFETIFLHDPASVARKLGIAALDLPQDISTCRGVKEQLSRNMPRGRSYKERIDQPSLTSLVRLAQVRASYSCMAHFERALLWLVRQNNPGLYPPRGV